MCCDRATVFYTLWVMEDFLALEMWYASVRLAYQQAIATSIEGAFGGQKPTVDAPNTAPSKLNLDTRAEIFERVFAVELEDLKQSDSQAGDDERWFFE